MRRTLSVVGVAIILVSAGCQRNVELDDRMLRILTATEKLSRQFDFLVKSETSDVEFRVQGIVEDSLRYRAIMSFGDENVVEEIVRDDALAVRVIDPSKLQLLSEDAAPSSQIIIEALNGGQWVVDPSGAPPLRRTENDRPSELDPVTEAITTPLYVRQAIEQAAAINEWREEDLSPAYRPSEDTFPPPDNKTGERRFDLVRPVLPTGASGLDQLPGPAHFRRMAIYVLGDRVVQIREHIDIDGHFEVKKAREEKKQRLLDLIKAVKTQQGIQGVVQRTMTIKFTNFGVPGDPTQLPDAIRASLRGIFDKTSSQLPAVPSPGENLDGVEEPPASPNS